MSQKIKIKIEKKRREKKEKNEKKKIISKKELKSKDMMAEQIFKLSKTSQNRQKMTFQRNKKK